MCLTRLLRGSEYSLLVRISLLQVSATFLPVWRSWLTMIAFDTLIQYKSCWNS